MFRAWLLTILAALIAVAGWAVIVAGMVLGGWWRVASAVPLAIFIGMLVIPSIFKRDNNFEETK